MYYTKSIRSGLSGIMRVKNDAELLGYAIESCIDALDELVIVYNDCTDGSPDVIRRYSEKYGDKIKVYPYNHVVYALNITKEEFEYASSLPEDSPHLFTTYSNFALSKVSFSHAIVIDADQFYFGEVLKAWRDVIVNGAPKISFKDKILGNALLQSFRIYRKISVLLGRRICFLPAGVIRFLYPHYLAVVRQNLEKDNCVVSFSGLNVYKDGRDGWCVPLGRMNSGINILPPFNGEGDHLVFKVSEQTFYEKFSFPYYNRQKSSNYSLIERFHHDKQVLPAEFLWFHLSTMRRTTRELTHNAKRENPSYFATLLDFQSMSFREIERRADHNMFTLYQRILFSLVFTAGFAKMPDRFERLEKIETDDRQ